MKRVNSRLYRLNYQLLFITKPDGVVVRYGKQKKSQVRLLLERVPFSKCELIVEYCPGYSNSGTYGSIEDVEMALRTFTEKDLLDFIEYE